MNTNHFPKFPHLHLEATGAGHKSLHETNTFQPTELMFTTVRTPKTPDPFQQLHVLDFPLSDFPSINKGSKAGQEQQLHRKTTQYRPVLHLLHWSLWRTTQEGHRGEKGHARKPNQSKKPHPQLKETTFEAEPEHKTLIQDLLILPCLMLLFWGI